MIVVGNRPTHDHFSKVSISNFLGDKNMTDMYCSVTKADKCKDKSLST